MNTYKILKHGIKSEGKYYRAWYSKAKFLNHPKGTITVYAKCILDGLPKCMKPENNTEIMTDYFEKDRVRIIPTHPRYNEFLTYANKNN